MALQLVDDDWVLEAALSFLDQPDAGPNDTMQSTTNKKKRGYNSNRARETQRKEVLALREQVPRLEKRLEMLKRKVSIVSLAAPTDMMRLWKKLAVHERKTRKHAEEENKRLRELVRENAEATTRNVHHLLQTIPGTLDSCPHTIGPRPEPWPWPYRRMYAVPIGPLDSDIFREMAENIDTVYRQVLQVYGGNADGGQLRSTEKAHCRPFADKILPFDVDSVGDAAWQFFAHSLWRPTTRFYYHTDSRQSSGFVSGNTVVESFGEEDRFDQVLLDAKVKQIYRRYIAAGRVVIAARALITVEKFKTEALNNVVYEEKGALVIEPYDETASIVHTWQMITPHIPEDDSSLQSELLHELTQFMLHCCRPGRAVQTMEQTLRAQSLQSAH